MKKLRNSITSSEEAQRLSNNLPSIWSKESYLSQRILIYACSLLEKLVENKSPKRKPSAWQSFFAKEIKAGKTAKEAAENWKRKKSQASRGAA
jgi:hypothetical protein